jgi:hypothetical protein
LPSLPCKGHCPLHLPKCCTYELFFFFLNFTWEAFINLHFLVHIFKMLNEFESTLLVSM